MNGTEKQNETSMEIPAEDSRVTMGNQTEKKHRFHLKMPQKGRKHSVKNELPTLLLRPWQLPCLSSA